MVFRAEMQTDGEREREGERGRGEGGIQYSAASYTYQGENEIRGLKRGRQPRPIRASFVD